MPTREDARTGTSAFSEDRLDRVAIDLNLDQAEKRRLKSGSLFGFELVDSVTRLCAMNLLLHGIGDEAGATALPVVTKDALAEESAQKYSLVLANSPFGRRAV